MKIKLLAASFAIWTAFVIFGLKSNHLCLAGSEADAPAHIDSTILLMYRGFSLYREPVARLGTRPAKEVADEFASRYGWLSDAQGVTDLLDIPERQGKPPLLVNWSYLPRPYPPGVFAVFLPEAILKEALDLNPKTAATIGLIELLLLAHVFLWFFWSQVLPAKAEGEDTLELAALIIIPLVYLETIFWTLHGFYDATAMIPLLLAARALKKRKGLETVFWYCLSLFLHFRALWYLPMLAWGAWLFFSQKEYRKQNRRQNAMTLSSLFMLGLSSYSFVLVYPWLMTLKPTNFFFTTADFSSWARLSYLLVPMGLLAGALAQNRARLLIACLAWTIVMLARSPFLQMWHSWYLTPLFALTGVGEKSAARSRTFVLIAYFVLASLAFTYFCFNGLLFQDAIKELWG